MKKNLITLVAALLVCVSVTAQSPQTLKIREYRKQHESGIIKEFVSFLSLPNIAKDTVNIRKNASFIMEMMNKRGIQKVQLLEGRTAGVPPVVYGEVNSPGAKQTIIFMLTMMDNLLTLHSGQTASIRSTRNYSPPHWIKMAVLSPFLQMEKHTKVTGGFMAAAHLMTRPGFTPF